MAKQLLVRNVPEEVHKWIDEERQQHRMSQQEFVLSVLQRASSLTPQTLPLPFESRLNKSERTMFKCLLAPRWDKHTRKACVHGAGA